MGMFSRLFGWGPPDENSDASTKLLKDDGTELATEPIKVDVIKVEQPRSSTGGDSGRSTLPSTPVTQLAINAGGKHLLPPSMDEGFYWTVQNLAVAGTNLEIGEPSVHERVRLPDISKLESFDLVLVFPGTATYDLKDKVDDLSFISDISEEEEKIPIEEVADTLLEIMWKREEPKDIAEGRSMMNQKGTLRYLSNIYDIKADIKALRRSGATKSKLISIVRKNIIRTLEEFMSSDIESVVPDMSEGDFVFYKVRLSEAAARNIACESEYLVQMDRRVAAWKEWRDDPSFVPPYAPYEDIFESMRSVACLKDAGLMWTRFDRLSQPMRAEGFDRDSDELSIFRDVDRVRLLRRGLDCLYNFEAMVEHGILETSYFLHQPNSLNYLRDEWADFRFMYTSEQPLEAIRTYFGDEVGLYFAWLGFYTSSLRAPAACGVVVHICQWFFDPDLTFDVPWVNVLRVLFSGFLVAWCTWFFYEWKRLERLYRLRWGLETTGGRGVRPRERSKFVSDRVIKDPVEPGRWIRSYATHKFLARRFSSNVLTFFVTLICVVGANQTVHEYILGKFVGKGFFRHDDSLIASMARTLSDVADVASWVTAILVKIFDYVFSSIIRQLVTYENHKHENDHNDALVLKLFFFKALDYFSPLVYVAFFKSYISPCQGGSCLGALRSQLQSIFMVAFFSNVLEVGQPAFMYWSKSRGDAVEVGGAGAVDEVVKQYRLEEYENTMEDYEEMINQFGLVTLFSLVTPVLPLFAWLSNMAEIRVDAFKLAFCYRRPAPREVQNIGAWMTVLQFLTILVVIINVALIVFATVGNRMQMLSKLILSVAFLSGAFAVKELVQHIWRDDTEQARIIRSRMTLVAQEALWGSHDDKIDASATMGARSFIQRSATQAYDRIIDERDKEDGIISPRPMS